MYRSILLSLLLAAQSQLQAAGDVDIYSSRNLTERTAALDKKGTPFASEDLQHYPQHYTMLAYRTETGASEIHEHEADLFVIQSGGATLVQGGKLVSPKTTKPGELRGTAITGGKRTAVAKGDIVHIPAGVAHQLVVEKGTPISYFVLKVTGQ